MHSRSVQYSMIKSAKGDLQVLTKTLLIAAFVATIAGSASAADKATVVLVHGAFEAASVWKPVEAQLRKDGFETVAVDLPGRDGAPPADPASGLVAYRDAVLAVINKQKDPVVLVGHSFGGMTISVVGEAAPGKIKKLVYVAAYLPKNGQSLVMLSQTDADSKMGPAFRISDDKRTASVDPAARGDLFCNDCDPKIKASVAAAIISEPLAPLAAPVALTDARFGKIDKVYIHTARDQVVSPRLQKEMIAVTPVREELTVDTGHAPFAAAPLELAEAIEKASQ
jgi:pimeloyl-ACP methyl ester carboxylesterase